MSLARSTLVLVLLAACHDGGGRDDGSASAPTGATTLPNLTIGSSSGASSGSSGSGAEGGTSGASTTGSGEPTTSGGPTGDSFPDSTVASWFGTSTTGIGPGDCDNVLHGTLRDFSQDHPDFEYKIEVDPGIVLPDLGPDKKPVYAGVNGNPTTTGQANFDMWYRDTPGVNQPFPLDIPLTNEGGLFIYDNSEFFPLDGQGFGDEGNPHNYHFTYEIHTEFAYEGGEVFKFRGDDDVWVFINGKLVIDLGGVHGPMEQTIDLDAFAATAGITPGGVYPLDFFFAERHTSESNFRIETTIACIKPPG